MDLDSSTISLALKETTTLSLIMTQTLIYELKGNEFIEDLKTVHKKIPSNAIVKGPSYLHHQLAEVLKGLEKTELTDKLIIEEIRCSYPAKYRTASLFPVDWSPANILKWSKCMEYGFIK